MRVLLCHNNLRVRSGADVFVHELARILEDRGHEVALFCAATPRDAPPSPGESRAEWASYFPRALDYAHNRLGAVARFDRLVYSRAARRSIERLIDEFRPDVAHCFAIYTKLTPSILDSLEAKGVPTVCSFNDYKHICPSYRLFHHGKGCEDCKGKHFYHAALNRCSHDSLVYSVAKAAEAYAHRLLNIYRKNVHTFLFASDFMARKTEEFWGTDSFRWQRLQNPFHSPGYALEREHGDYLLFVGRLVEEKGVDVLLRAMARVPHARLKILGDGRHRTTLEKLAQSLSLRNVEFLGSLWGSDRDRLLARARFTVVPSLWPENYPYVINLSFAMGKAVVAADVGGIPEMVSDGRFGLLYPAQDEQRLAECITELWGDPERCLAMGTEAKAYSDAEFNDDRFYARLMGVYGELLE